MKIKKLFALALALVMACSVFAGCTSNDNGASSDSSAADSSTSEQSVAGESSTKESSEESSEVEPTGTSIYPGTPGTDMVTVQISAEPPDMNTLTTTDTISFMLMKNLYENLVRLDENDEITPGAAESWDISEDGLTYTFHLREGAVWSNGEPVTANDFEFAWKEALNPDIAAEYAYFLYDIAGGEAYNNSTGSRDDVKVTAVDDVTLEVVLNQPTEYFLDKTAFGTLSPINEAFYNEVGADKYGTEADYILSNGPFTMESWVHESEVVLIKNETYFNADAIKMPKIKFTIITDTNAIMNAFMAGEIDLATLTLGTMVDQIEATGYETLQYDDGASFYLQMNQKSDILSNLNMRLAIGYAIDREAFVNTVLQNSSKPAVSLTAPAIMDNNGKTFADRLDSPWPITGDADTAKEYLEKGLEELGITIEEAGAGITLITDDGDAALTMGAFMKEQLNSKLGLDIVVESMPFKSRLERVKNYDYSMVLGGWGPDYNDPNTFLDLFVTDGGNNQTGFSNEEYDQLIADAAVELDSDKRMEMFDRVEEIIWENAVVAPVYWRARDYVVSEKLGGVYRTAFQDCMYINSYINE